jgi:hypothetical protein
MPRGKQASGVRLVHDDANHRAVDLIAQGDPDPAGQSTDQNGEQGADQEEDETATEQYRQEITPGHHHRSCQD